ncbi:MAG: hypothetical protein EPN17_09625 [Methylobacter sp.]|nr:MAG: hypothetical protein EPN17_09625 [Methylobacter sp.]
MPNQDEPNKTESPLPSPRSDDTSENVVDSLVGNFKTLLIAIGGLVLVLSILILLPMFLTYLSEGDYRAPSEIHPTDTAIKNSQNAYNLVKPDK